MNEAEYLIKNYGDLGGCYPSRPYRLLSTDNTLLDLHNSLKDTQPHLLMVNLIDTALFSSIAGKYLFLIFTSHFEEQHALIRSFCFRPS